MAEEIKDKAEEVKEPQKDSKQETKGMACSPNHKILAVIIVGTAVIVVLGAGAFSVMHLKGSRLGSRKAFSNHLGGPGIRGYGHMGGGFYGGRGGMMRGGNIANQNAISGKVTAVNDKKFTIDASGTPKDIQISDTTRFPLNSATSVKVGDTVIVRGQQDSSGVIQATTILVNPQTN